MIIEEWSNDDLVDALRRQYPWGFTSIGNCPICGKPSRGSGYCADCIQVELARRHGGEVRSMVRTFRNALYEAQRANALAEKIEAEMREAVRK